jgi:hypothetical protein
MSPVGSLVDFDLRPTNHHVIPGDTDMIKARKRYKQATDAAEFQASIDAFDLFGSNDEIQDVMPMKMTPKPDHVVRYEYAGPREMPKSDMDELWGAIERLADSDPTPSPWRSGGI